MYYSILEDYKKRTLINEPIDFVEWQQEFNWKMEKYHKSREQLAKEWLNFIDICDLHNPNFKPF